MAVMLRVLSGAIGAGVLMVPVLRVLVVLTVPVLLEMALPVSEC